MSDLSPRTARRSRPSWALLVAVPFVCAFVLQWLPAINGPHLWFGVPSILWWTTLPGSVLVSLVLLYIELTRDDDEEQDELDRLAVPHDEEAVL